MSSHKQTSDKLGMVLNLLDHKALSHLQALDVTDTMALRKTLEMVLQDSHNQEQIMIAMRQETTSEMLDAYDQERKYERQIVDFNDRFVRKMAVTFDNDNKEAFQQQALDSIKMSEQASRLARDYRARVEHYRTLLSSLSAKSDDVSNHLIDVLFGVVLQAMDCPAKVADKNSRTKEYPEPQPGISTVTTETLDNQLGYLSPVPVTGQSVLAHYPRQTDQGVDELVGRVAATDLGVGLDTSPRNVVVLDDEKRNGHEDEELLIKKHVKKGKKQDKGRKPAPLSLKVSSTSEHGPNA